MMHQWDYWKTAGPTEEPLALGDAKHFLAVGSDVDDEDDDLIESLITSARAEVEEILGRTLVETTYKLQIDGFPAEIVIPKPPLLSIEQIDYFDEDGQSQTLSASNYQINKRAIFGVVKPAYNTSWPATRTGIYDAVTITYKAGYGNKRSSIPADIVEAIRLIVSTRYDVREDLIIGTNVSKIPNGAESLLMRHKVRKFDLGTIK